MLGDREALAACVREHGQTVQETDSWDDLFFKVFLSKVEPHLGWNEDHTVYQPTFLTHYPASMAALARKDRIILVTRYEQSSILAISNSRMDSRSSPMRQSNVRDS